MDELIGEAFTDTATSGKEYNEIVEAELEKATTELDGYIREHNKAIKMVDVFEQVIENDIVV